MRVWLAAVTAVALITAGCGAASGGGSSDDAAGLVPADALGYATVNTDLGSSQLKSAQAILDKFPIKDKVLTQIRSSLAKEGTNVEGLISSVGPQLDVAILKVNGETGAVGFTKPKDEQAFDAQLDKAKTVHTTIDSWTVFADKQPFLDAVKNRQANLSDDDAYQAAVKTVPGSADAIARFYAAGGGVQTALGAATSNLGSAGSALGSVTAAKWVAGALTSQDDAFKLEVHAKTATEAEATGSGLAGAIPSGAIIALHLVGGGSVIPASATTQLETLSQQLHVDLVSLIGALRGPVIAYVRPGIPIPEVTIAAQPPHPLLAAKAVGELLGRVASGATPQPTKVEGGTLQKLDLGPVAIYYGVNGDRLVVTDSADALAELNGSAGHLTDDSVYKEAKDGAGMPDASQGFLFVDLKDAVPALSGLAQLANVTIPPDVAANLKPLRSLLVFGERDADIQTLVAYLKTS